MLRYFLTFLTVTALVSCSSDIDYSSIEPVEPSPTPMGDSVAFDSIRNLHKGAIVSVIHEKSSSDGTGFIALYEGDTYLITVAHIYADSTSILEVITGLRSVQFYPNKSDKPVIINKSKDIAIVPFDINKYHLRVAPLELTDENTLPQGEIVAAMCSSEYFDTPINVGKYAGTGEDINVKEYKHDMLVVRMYQNNFPYGCSGGATLNGDGKVIGMYRMTGNMRVRYLVPASEIINLLKNKK